jgi:hypothetical protein
MGLGFSLQVPDEVVSGEGSIVSCFPSGYRILWSARIRAAPIVSKLLGSLFKL